MIFFMSFSNSSYLCIPPGGYTPFDNNQCRSNQLGILDKGMHYTNLHRFAGWGGYMCKQ